MTIQKDVETIRASIYYQALGDPAHEALERIQHTLQRYEEAFERLKQHADRECGCQVETHALSTIEEVGTDAATRDRDVPATGRRR